MRRESLSRWSLISLMVLALSACGGTEAVNEEEGTVLIERGVLFGPIESDTSLEAGIWQVEREISIGARLVIPAGSRLEFTESGGLKVKEGGSIEAKGESGRRVVFQGRSAQAGYWLGLSIASRTPSTLDFVTIRHAGSSGSFHFNGAQSAAITLQAQGLLTLRDSRIEANKGAGLLLEEEAALQGFERNTFSNNAGMPVSLHAHQGGMLDSASDYDGDPEANEKNHVAVKAARILVSSAWPKINVPYRVSGEGVVEGSDTVLSILGGNTVEFMADSGLRTKDGGLSIVGTPNQRVLLKGVESRRGYWLGLAFHSSHSANLLSFTDISDAGSGSTYLFNQSTKSGVWVHGSARVKISDSSISNSLGVGLRALGGASLEGFSSNSFHANEGAGVWVDASVARFIDEDSDFVGLPDNGLPYVRVSGETLRGENIWRMPGTRWLIDGEVVLENASGKLEISPGNTLMFLAGGGIKAKSGALVALGTSEAPIVFEGDDRLPGAWHGIAIDSNLSANVLRNVTVRHGGEVGNSLFNQSMSTNVFIAATGRLTLEDVKLELSSGHGLVVRSGGQYTSSGLSFAGNSLRDILDQNP